VRSHFDLFYYKLSRTPDEKVQTNYQRLQTIENKTVGKMLMNLVNGLARY
jgi:hypothetical protein